MRVSRRDLLTDAPEHLTAGEQSLLRLQRSHDAQTRIRMFSSTTEYALRASVFLASMKGESASSERIAESTKVPAGYISKVMRDLVVAGLVESQRGPNGGFTLARDPSAITVLDVVDAVTPLQRIQSCPLGNPSHLNLCPLHRRLDEAIASIQDAFRKTTLAEVSEPSAKGQVKGPQCGALTVSAALKTSVPRTAKKGVGAKAQRPKS
jgi:Rrf2 family transcriptional regulator, nitric oxide-sensitive transcriptional repressor